jgi:serine/threonine-protein kinase
MQRRIRSRCFAKGHHACSRCSSTRQLGRPRCGAADGLLWFTMPFVEGENLRERPARTGPAGVGEVARIIRQAAQALARAHEQGVIHREVKPANLLLTKEGTVLVADFGIARATAGLRGLPDTGATRMTQAASPSARRTAWRPNSASAPRRMPGPMCGRSRPSRTRC